MALLASSGLRTKAMTTGSVKSLLDGGLIKIYKGTAPTTADDAEVVADLLCTISLNSSGTGITLQAGGAAGSLVKTSGETWSGVVSAAGTNTATYYRHVASGDTGASSTTEARLQGSISTSGAEMNLANTSLANGSTQTIDYYNLDFPTA